MSLAAPAPALPALSRQPRAASVPRRRAGKVYLARSESLPVAAQPLQPPRPHRPRASDAGASAAASAAAGAARAPPLKRSKPGMVSAVAVASPPEAPPDASAARPAVVPRLNLSVAQPAGGEAGKAAPVVSGEVVAKHLALLRKQQMLRRRSAEDAALANGAQPAEPAAAATAAAAAAAAPSRSQSTPTLHAGAPVLPAIAAPPSRRASGPLHGEVASQQQQPPPPPPPPPQPQPASALQPPPQQQQQPPQPPAGAASDAPLSPRTQSSLEALRTRAERLQQEGGALDALQQREEALRLLIARRGQYSSDALHATVDYVTRSNLLAMQLLGEDRDAEALALFQTAESLCLTLPLLRAVTYTNLSCYFRKVRQLHAALDYLKRALELEDQVGRHQGTLPQRADTCVNLCTILSELKRHNEAATYAVSAVSHLQQEIFGRVVRPSEDPAALERLEHVSEDRLCILGIAYHNLAIQQEHRGHHAGALLSYERAYLLMRRHLGAAHAHSQNLCRAFRNAQTRLGPFVKAVGPAPLRASARRASAASGGSGGASPSPSLRPRKLPPLQAGLPRSQSDLAPQQSQQQPQQQQPPARAMSREPALRRQQQQQPPQQQPRQRGQSVPRAQRSASLRSVTRVGADASLPPSQQQPPHLGDEGEPPRTVRLARPAPAQPQQQPPPPAAAAAAAASQRVEPSSPQRQSGLDEAARAHEAAAAVGATPASPALSLAASFSSFDSSDALPAAAAAASSAVNGPLSLLPAAAAAAPAAAAAANAVAPPPRGHASSLSSSSSSSSFAAAASAAAAATPAAAGPAAAASLASQRPAGSMRQAAEAERLRVFSVSALSALSPRSALSASVAASPLHSLLVSHASDVSDVGRSATNLLYVSSESTRSALPAPKK